MSVLSALPAHVRGEFMAVVTCRQPARYTRRALAWTVLMHARGRRVSQSRMMYMIRKAHAMTDIRDIYPSRNVEQAHDALVNAIMASPRAPALLLLLRAAAATAPSGGALHRLLSALADGERCDAANAVDETLAATLEDCAREVPMHAEVVAMGWECRVAELAGGVPEDNPDYDRGPVAPVEGDGFCTVVPSVQTGRPAT